MHKVQIGKGQTCGNLWTRKPTPDKFGCVLEVSRTTPAGKFTRCAFSPCGERIAVADQLGNIFIFDIHKNRYSLLYSGGKFCTALCFPSLNIVVAAFTDSIAKVIDSGTQEVVGELAEPRPITSLSSHDAGRYLLTTSTDAGSLWDLETMNRKRSLAGASGIGLKEMLFVPRTNVILTCFRDDSVFAWDCETMEQRYSLSKQDQDRPAFTCFTPTTNGDFLVAGGRSRYLHVWRLSDQKLHHIVELPERVKSVRQLVSLAQIFDEQNNTIFGVLSQEGVLRFISLNTYKILFSVGGVAGVIGQAAVSPSSKHIAVVMETGAWQLLSVKAMTKKLNPAPVPTVKAVTVPPQSMKLVKGGEGEEEGRKRRCLKQPAEMGTLTKVDLKKLRMILKGYGEYPEKYRHFIWRLLLKIPENTESYGVLIDKGTHPSYEKLQETCPMKSAKLLRILQKVLSCMGHWSSIFSITDFLPMLTFPFAKMFQNNHHVAFEITATFVLNWCQGWFEFFPHPPVNVLTATENLLNHHDNRLLQHLSNCNVSAKVYAWTLLYTVFSEVFSTHEWMVFMDHVLSNHPGFLLCLLVVYLSLSRQALLGCTKAKDFEYYFHNRNRVLLTRLISNAYTLWDSCPSEIHPRNFFKPFTALPKGDYPVFNNYPEKVVDYQLKERERILAEELAYVRERQVGEELRLHTDQLRQAEEGWRREQEMLAEAEEQRRRVLRAEETKLAEQRIRLQAMKRELRLSEVKVLDAARKNFIETAERDHRDKLKYLEEEIARKAKLREQETKGAVEEVALKELEMEIQKGLLEQQLERDMYVSRRRQEVVLAGQREQEELAKRRSDLDESLREDRATLNVQDAQTDLARSTVKSLALRHDRDTERARQMNAVYTEMALGSVREREARARTDREQLETVLREATRDMHQEILEQRAAVERQRQEAQETEERVEGLCREIKELRATAAERPPEDESEKENEPEVVPNRRRESVDRRQADVLKHVKELRNKISLENASLLKS